MARIYIENSNIYSTFVANQANADYIQNAGDQQISNDYYSIQATTLAENRNFDLNGYVFGTQNGIAVGDIFGQSLASTVHVGKSGFISAAKVAVQMAAAGDRVTNDGVILARDAAGTGVSAFGDNFRCVNSGLISGESGIVVRGDHNVINNNGELIGTYAFRSYSEAGDVVKFSNHGTVTGAANAVLGQAGRETVINSGQIYGAVFLGDGNDVYASRHGHVTGVVNGGAGNDRYIIDNKDYDLAEGMSAGTDRVTSSVSWTLGDNFEQLVLTGKGNLKGIGNDLDNLLLGNRGANRISAGNGVDYIDGKAGNDLLSGGMGADEFHFIRHGGHDTITDFEAGYDHIDISAFAGIDSFKDLLNHHVKVHGNDIVITAGDDMLTLKNMSINDLQAGDFSL